MGQTPSRITPVVPVTAGSMERRRSTSDDEEPLAKKRKEEEEREERRECLRQLRRENKKFEEKLRVLREEKRKEPFRTAIMERMTQPDIPTEVLRNIIGFTLRPTVPFCRISTDDGERRTWKEYADQGKALAWPENLSSNAKQVIQQAVADTFPESVILVMPAKFEYSASSFREASGYRLAIPRALQGSESKLRNLVLNLDLSLIRSMGRGEVESLHWCELRAVRGGIQLLAQKFPMLETCVLVIQIGNFPDIPSEEPPCFPAIDCIVDRNRKWRVALFELINGFAKRGPGKRRLLRFECHMMEIGGSPAQTCNIAIGPLIRVDVSNGRGVGGGGNESVVAEVERLLHQVYLIKRWLHCGAHGGYVSKWLRMKTEAGL
jgi:hypothetical protein